MVHVQLVRGVKLLLQQGTRVQVQTQEDCGNARRFLVEPDSSITDLGLSVEPTLQELKDGTAQLVITNLTGFTQRLDQGLDIETLEEAEVVPSSIDTFIVEKETLVQDDQIKRYTVVNAVSIISWRQDKVCKMFQDNLSLPDPKKENFVNFLWIIIQCLVWRPMNVVRLTLFSWRLTLGMFDQGNKILEDFHLLLNRK